MNLFNLQSQSYLLPMSARTGLLSCVRKHLWRVVFSSAIAKELTFNIHNRARRVAASQSVSEADGSIVLLEFTFFAPKLVCCISLPILPFSKSTDTAPHPSVFHRYTIFLSVPASRLYSQQNRSPAPLQHKQVCARTGNRFFQRPSLTPC